MHTFFAQPSVGGSAVTRPSHISSIAIFTLSLSHLATQAESGQAGPGQARIFVSDLPPAAISKPDLPSNAAHAQLGRELKLAGDYYAGRGVAQDLSQSAYWYRKAADRGDPGAQVELGYFYLHGIGVDQDSSQALRWFARAAASGNHLAKLNLAVLYLKGAGVEQDTALGTKMLQELVKLHDARAEGYLGIMYMLGVGVEQNVQAAEKLFKDGAHQKNAEAEYSLGVLYSGIPDHHQNLEKAAGYFRRSAAQGYIASMHHLGMLLINHPRFSLQPGEAVQMLTKAADAGSWRSSLSLAILCKEGQYAPANLGMAYRWFLIAAQQGGSEAEKWVKSDLAIIRTKLDPIERDTIEKDANSWLLQHPHQDIYKFPGGLEHAYYPLEEVYVNDMAEPKLSTKVNNP